MSSGAVRPLLLVPGLVCDVEAWHHQADHLAEVAEISIAPVETGETMQDMAAAVVEAAPDRFALAGFSMGGYVALEMLRQAPERITRLALLDTSARPDTPEKRAGREAAIAACRNGEYRQVIEGMLPVLLCEECRRSPLADFVRAMMERVGPEVFARRHRAMMTRTDGRDVLAAAEMPVRIIFGREDGMSTLEEHQEMADLAGGRLSIIEECGHMTIIERPHAVSALLRDWLLYG